MESDDTVGETIIIHYKALTMFLLIEKWIHVQPFNPVVTSFLADSIPTLP